ncbi:hypothetical protein OXIME_000545 [Oxyplasma meridianum]|uniref:Uncharacterized protein n=1 Tax=Oxyplasma meridianum TaxID=3073602 RepID=A0AAX4NET8_9ARCH
MVRKDPKEFSLLPSLEYGIIYASMSLMEKSGIPRVIKMNSGGYSHILNFMVISRLLENCSDLGLVDLIDSVYYPWNYLHLSDDNIYRALHRIESE